MPDAIYLAEVSVNSTRGTDSRLLGLILDVPTARDAATLREWISASGELRLISSEASQELSPETLDEWVEAAVASAVIRIDDDPIAFGTLSVEEAPLPLHAAEICHLIVHPQWRRRYNGSHLVLELAAKARDLGFHAVAGRVVPENAVARAFLSRLGWRQLAPGDPWLPGFSWYMKDLGDV